MARVTDAPKVVTANRLQDGAVVWLTAAGTWSTRVADAQVQTDAPLAETALGIARASAARQEVVEPYAVDVVVEATGPRPLKTREWIRAAGPSIDAIPTAA
ncbi:MULTISPECIES: DUF2849 domain-containing protein [Nitrospirillum]|uniref:Uncharacterized protein DUF2849 n=1 Tax=Nitrospirillum amazonense TaxID=28077 RepID=A0A560G0Z8_9PROT|nr:DUF2849 domain-containing protein [Nitrospirillum amazonense]MEC4589622.1 DUF2849 domain-containing protein [Nitrospirillum amazonense]TWB27565.1 uncharacterized protein DUF2849 [Nitrospirillum amazonense]